MRTTLRSILLDDAVSGIWDIDAANPLYWLSLHPNASRTSAITIATGVSAVTDVSGNGYTTTQANATQQPAYLSTGFNGFPAINFDGSDDNFALNAIPQSYNQAVFAVIDTTNLAGGDRVLLNRTNPAAAPAAYLGLNTGSYRPAIFWGDSRAAQTSDVRRQALFFWQIGGNGTGFNRTNIDAQNLVSQANTQTGISTWNFINSNFGLQQSNISLSELIVINNPSQDTIDRVHGILAHRWWRLAGLAVPLAVSHPYFSSPPTR